MKRIHKLLLSVISGLLFALSWPEHGFPLLIMVAFIPLLMIENEHWKNRQSNSPYGVFGYAYLAFLIWNALTTYWIYNSTLVGAIFAIVANSLFMSIVFHVFHITRRNMISRNAGYISLIAYWLSFEFLHLRWDLNWPWLNLGHVFAAWPKWIQWYEFTGVSGGSLWIFMINMLIFIFIRDKMYLRLRERISIGISASIVLILFVPVLASFMMYSNYREKSSPVDVVVVQPNLDPYSEQYELNPLEVVDRMLNLAQQKADSLTQFIVCPESAIQEYIFEDRFNDSPSIAKFRALNRNYPLMNSITGLSSRKIFGDNEPLSPTARKFRDADKYYDAYNTALLIARDSSLQAYHKSKLTPGVEMMPYPRVFRFLEKFALDLGGTVGSLGTDADQIPFRINDSLKIATIICYESVYGEFVTRFVKNGANLIFVITNDGWWGNTPGHRQHLLFSVIRSIETRRSIARSANTGISCFINQRGDISQRTGYWVPAAIREKINANNYITFYVRYGDFISRVCLLVMGLMVLLTISNILRRRTSHVQVK